MSGEKNYRKLGREYGEDFKEPGISRSKALGITALIAVLLLFQAGTFIWEKWIRPAPAGHYEAEPAGKDPGKYGKASPERISGAKPSRPPAERFPFDPNTISLEDLCRLGFTSRQAQTILNYRSKGGVFRRPEDFARMYVVSETLYRDLEPWITIGTADKKQEKQNAERKSDAAGKSPATAPDVSAEMHGAVLPGGTGANGSGSVAEMTVDLNTADSAELVSLRGIGPYYARKILQYRRRLGSFCIPEQVMDIPGIDSARFALFKDRIFLHPEYIRRFSLDTAGWEFMSRHPYIGPYTARGILLFRRMKGTEKCTPEALVKENILTPEQAARLERTVL